MDRLDKLFDKFFDLLERFIIPIVLLLLFFVYRKVSGFFTSESKEKEEKTKAAEEHNTSLSGGYKVAPKNASKATVKKIAIENGETAKKYKQALYAERIYACTRTFSMSWNRRSDLMKWAQGMKDHKVSLVGTAHEYHRLTGTQTFYADVRSEMGDEYPKWLTLAGSTP